MINSQLRKFWAKRDGCQPVGMMLPMQYRHHCARRRKEEL